MRIIKTLAALALASALLSGCYGYGHPGYDSDHHHHHHDHHP